MALERDKHPTYSRAPYSAASQRAPLRGEILPIDVTTASKRFAVPESWKGTYVRFQADGANVYVQVSTGDNASADIAARAVETGTNPIALTPHAGNNGCFKIPADTWLDIPFPADANTFALVGSAACVARTHPSET